MPSTPKVLYLCQSFPVVSETFISDQVEALLQQGVPVKVLALKHGNNLARTAQWNANPQHAAALQVMYPQGVGIAAGLKSLPYALCKILGRPASWGLTLYCTRHARGLLAQACLMAAWLHRNPQLASVLICHFGNIGYVGALLKAWGALPPSTPQVTVFHGFDMSSFLRRKPQAFYRALFNSPRHASVPITDFWQSKLMEMGDPAATTIKLGVNTNAIVFNPRQYPSNRPVRLITVGRLTSKKGQEDVLRALASLPSDMKWATNWEYHLIGAGPQQVELQQLTRELGLENKVVFHGALPHIQTLEHLAKADVFVLTSRMGEDGDMEGLPVALMEALASGMPTLSTFHSGIPELITHEETGLLSPEGDIKALSQNLETILSTPDVWGKLTHSGRLKVEKDYKSVINFEKFWSFVTKLINEK